ncbi:T9SS type A sorting domain-containing protein, partial [Aestuariivivens sp. NBU2969]|uniref:T9SS type A sorting domain-containing protein n=1 Tax=Aestuariivivens sp. NBU2969 TaxID=2873267 RepID=UPI001CBB0724
DGTPNCLDGCPDDPNKTDPGVCGCGTAETDTDSDGVLDCNDLEINSPCPLDVDINGVSNDDDSDGTPNCLDGCPDDPNKTDPGVCGCGTAETDTDSDGVLDCNDLCEGSDDTIDTDSDGIPDGCDNCSSVANPNQADADTDGIGDACEGLDNAEFTFKEVSIIPNPFNAVINIQLPVQLNNEEFKITLYDITGKMIRHEEKEAIQGRITMERLEGIEQGLYLLRISYKDTRSGFKRLVKL